MFFFIDDEYDMRLANQQTFSLAEIDAQFVADAESALIAMKESLPHVIISDIRLPGISGQQLLTTLNERDPDLPIILIQVMAIFQWQSKRLEMERMIL